MEFCIVPHPPRHSHFHPHAGSNNFFAIRSEKLWYRRFLLWDIEWRLRVQVDRFNGFNGDGVSRFCSSNIRHLNANEKDSSTSVGMTLREYRSPHKIFKQTSGTSRSPVSSFRAQPSIFVAAGFSLLFRPPLCMKHRPPRYGVSHFSPSNTRHFTANEKDPSTSVGMTLREYRSPHISRTR